MPLVALGLSLPFNSNCGWVTHTGWSAFAILAALVQLAPALGGGFGWSARTGWMVGAVATGALIAGVTMAIAGWLDNIGPQAGELVYLLALAALLLAVKDRLIWPGQQASMRQPSTASTSPATSRILSSSTAPWRST